MAEVKKTTKTTVAKTTTKATAPKATAAKAPAKTATKTAAAKTTTSKTTAPKTVKAAPAKAAEVKEAPVKEVKKPVAKKANAAPKTLRVTLVRSTIGFNKTQAKTIEALGLGKLHSSNDLVDNAAVRGMIFKVKHLVKVEDLRK